MTEFTKGKWRVINEVEIVSDIAEGYYIAEMCTIDCDEECANARLIAAAPEMYELLRECMNKIHSFDETYRLIENLIERIDGDNLKGGE